MANLCNELSNATFFRLILELKHLTPVFVLQMKFTEILIHWYSKNKRILPWRENIDPYRVWLSEIILQQTRVEQGLPYFNTFINTYPTVMHLALASEPEVLKLWQGLGYYSRARNLHFAAKTVAQNYNGSFPNTFNELKKLKGVGDYTAAAIASICFNEAVPVVDGNVYRFLSRYFGIDTPIDSSAGKKMFFAQAASLVPTNNAGDFNQGMMEFGALVCTPQNPDCKNCVFAETCFALRYNKVSELPVKKGKTKVLPLYLNYAHIQSVSGFYLQQRPANGVWGNMYEFPVLATDQPATIQQLNEFFADLGLELSDHIATSEPVKHLLTHKRIEARFHSFEPKKYKPSENLHLVNEPKTLEKYALPKLIEQFVEKSIFNNS
jgi:A/G-specific adenine glycosylase